jgi:hypothetical protein
VDGPRQVATRQGHAAEREGDFQGGQRALDQLVLRPGAAFRRGRRSSIPICRRTRRIGNSGASLSTCCASTSPTRSPPGTSAWRC